MKVLLLVLLPCLLKAQVKSEYDSLKKYIYPILIFDANLKPLGNGTGFFIKNKEKVFFVTNHHVAYRENCDRIRILRNNTYYDIFPQRFVNNSKYDISKFYITDNLFVSNINELSKFVDPSFFSKISNKTVACGYADTSHIINQIKLWYKVITTKYETNREILKILSLSEENLIIKDTVYKGMSGSPLFGEFIIRNRRTLKFIGVIYKNIKSNNLFLNKGVAVKAKELIEYLTDPL